jgi:uncharacterized membrane protein YedE/YeeE
MSNYILALILGMMFGFALNKGGLTRYANIAGVYRFTNLTVIKFMMTAIATAMIGLYGLKELGIITFPAVPATYILGNILGGLIFGVGMALAGYCPGTIAAGAGEGKLDYLLPGVSGLIAGALLFGFTYQWIFPVIVKVANLGNVTLPGLLGVNSMILVAIFVILTLVLFYFLEHGWARRDRVE